MSAARPACKPPFPGPSISARSRRRAGSTGCPDGRCRGLVWSDRGRISPPDRRANRRSHICIARMTTGRQRLPVRSAGPCRTSSSGRPWRDPARSGTTRSPASGHRPTRRGRQAVQPERWRIPLRERPRRLRWRVGAPPRPPWDAGSCRRRTSATPSPGRAAAPLSAWTTAGC